jgi:hypothetical protein
MLDAPDRETSRSPTSQPAAEDDRVVVVAAPPVPGREQHLVGCGVEAEHGVADSDAEDDVDGFVDRHGQYPKISKSRA